MSTCERILLPLFLSLSIMMENKVEEKELEMVAEATDRGSQCPTEGKGRIPSPIPWVDWPMAHQKDEEEKQLP